MGSGGNFAPLFFWSSKLSDSPTVAAEALAQRGDFPDAIALLQQAAENGDANAAMLLAVWHLRGDMIARDLVAARQMLRRAVKIGHVDAALLEIALVANGSGAAPDWPLAVQLLRQASSNDPLAAMQLRVLDAMHLDPNGEPTQQFTIDTLSDAPSIRLFRQFLSAEECEQVARAAHGLLAPAVVVDPASGRTIAHPVRTSHVAVLGPANENLVIQAINRRIAAASSKPVTHGEPLNVLRYTPGQQYRRHLDTLPGASNQRVATMILYLNQGFAGGETRFPALNKIVQPRAGDALLFETLLPDGLPDPRLIHSGEPVRAGTKWIATRWIRQQAVDPWTIAAS